MTQRILVAVDDSRESLAAAHTAARLAKDLQALVRIFIVVEDDGVGEEVQRVCEPGSRERRRQAASNLLEYVRREVCAEGVSPSLVDVAQAAGNPFRQILEAARTWPADMIVMAVSDQRGVVSNYVGSVTEQVIEFADCPILVVPAPAPR
jgi:nucleotide-binding universal stress UspA family protein